jgi:hypothetical protein
MYVTTQLPQCARPSLVIADMQTAHTASPYKRTTPGRALPLSLKSNWCEGSQPTTGL